MGMNERAPENQPFMEAENELAYLKDTDPYLLQIYDFDKCEVVESKVLIDKYNIKCKIH